MFRGCLFISRQIAAAIKRPKGEGGRQGAEVAVLAADGLPVVSPGLPCLVVLSARGGVKKRPVTA